MVKVTKIEAYSDGKIVLILSNGEFCELPVYSGMLESFTNGSGRLELYIRGDLTYRHEPKHETNLTLKVAEIYLEKEGKPTKYAKEITEINRGMQANNR